MVSKALEGQNKLFPQKRGKLKTSKMIILKPKVFNFFCPLSAK
jgi:hypothetical protein